MSDERSTRPFLLLDRDGTLIAERDYLHDPKQVELLDGARELVSAAEARGWGVAIVTNQSGVSRGFFSLDDVEAVNRRVVELVGEPSLTLESFFVCPHGPDDGCNCRKPLPGLAVAAAERLGADLRRSIVVGDKRTDLELGRAIGATTILVRTGYGAEEEASAVEFADHVVDGLSDVRHLIGEIERARTHLLTSAEVMTQVRERCIPDLVEMSRLVAESMASGGKLLICGNGGSAADSQHLAAEFVVRLSADFERPALPAIALTVDSSTLTAFGNDYGFERVFARQVEALGKKGDVLLVISTSGGSANVIAAAQTAREIGLTTIGLLGGTGGSLKQLVDRAAIVPSPTTQHVQESHLALYHLLCALVERRLFAPDPVAE